MKKNPIAIWHDSSPAMHRVAEAELNTVEFARLEKTLLNEKVLSLFDILFVLDR